MAYYLQISIFYGIKGDLIVLQKINFVILILTISLIATYLPA